MSQEDWIKDKTDQWQTQARTYPIKGLIALIEPLYREQVKRLGQQHGQLDAATWSKEEWEQED